MKKKKYIAVFLIKEQDSYNIEKNIRFNPTNKKVSYRDFTYPLDIGVPSYSRGLKLYYFIDVEIGQLNFDKSNKANINAKVIDMILAQKIIAQLTANLTHSNFKTNLWNIIIGLLIGGLVGYIAGGIVIT